MAPISLQSPIDLTSPITRADLSPLDFRYPAGGVAATAEFRVASGDPIDGRPRAVPQVVVTPPPGAADLRIDGRTYVLQSLHWHSPAEHAVHGRRPPMELHLVHAGPDGGILVVGVLYTVGLANPALAPVFDRLGAIRDAPSDRCPRPRPRRRCCPRPVSRASYRYQGSLTTADDEGRFREGVQWVVLRHRVAAGRRPTRRPPCPHRRAPARRRPPPPPRQRARSPALRRADHPHRRLTALTSRRRSRRSADPSRPTARRPRRAR